MTNNSSALRVDDHPPDHWPIAAARAAEEKLGTRTLIIDVGDVLAITSYFVITSGASNRQVRAIAEEIEQNIASAGGPKPLRREGFDGLEWVLLDYGDFVAHVQHQDTREYYQLERLWGDQPKVEWKSAEMKAAEAKSVESQPEA